MGDTIAAENHEVRDLDGPSETILGWALLVGSIIFPEIFSPLGRMGVLRNPATGAAAQLAIRNIPRRYLAGCSCLLLGFGVGPGLFILVKA
ncbi:hypothetical protein F5Y03DRAFT_401546 [Xylaria venustula]|nr:hypothetical protein F5Y03DRAFT_401546 [Xylaria venustula]